MEFEPYKPRKIEFIGLQEASDWSVKVYTITLHQEFKAKATLNYLMQNLEHEFVNKAKASLLPVHRHAFLIVHEAREGVWILFSWWTGGEMLETIVRFVSFQNPEEIKPTPHEGSLICTWELEVYIQERKAWIEHVLEQANAPDFKNYSKDILNSN